MYCKVHKHFCLITEEWTISCLSNIGWMVEKTREMLASQLKRYVGHDKTNNDFKKAGNTTENVFIAISSDQGLKKTLLLLLFYKTWKTVFKKSKIFTIKQKKIHFSLTALREKVFFEPKTIFLMIQFNFCSCFAWKKNQWCSTVVHQFFIYKQWVFYTSS